MRRPLGLVSLLLMFGCASRTEMAKVDPPVILVPKPVAALPPGASPGMAIPAMLADGTYPTPNRDLSAAAKVWHLRAGLNVAALACRDAEAGRIVAGYNAMLSSQKAALASAQMQMAAEYRARGGDWEDAQDDAMTRLYNFFSLSPARAAFCAAAERVIAQAATVTPAEMPAFAAAKLPELDRPFTDFYVAYDAWRRGSMVPQPLAPRAPVMAMASAPRIAPANGVVAQPVPRAVPYLRVDPKVLAQE